MSDRDLEEFEESLRKRERRNEVITQWVVVISLVTLALVMLVANYYGTILSHRYWHEEAGLGETHR